MALRCGPFAASRAATLLLIVAAVMAGLTGADAAQKMLRRLSSGRPAGSARVAAAAAALSGGRPLHPVLDRWNDAPVPVRVEGDDDDDDDKGGDKEGGKGNGGECKAKYELERGMLMAGEMVAPPEETILLDSSTTFLRRTRGFSPRQVEQSRHEAFDHFHERFGIDMTGARYNETAGVYMSRDGKFVAFAFALAFPLAKVADSAKLVECPDTLAMWGGWGAEGEGVTLRGTWGGPDGVEFEDEAMALYSYLVFSPGSRHSTVVKMAGRAPMVCTDAGTCALSDTMVLDDGIHEPAEGAAEGVLSFEPAGGEGKRERKAGGESRTVLRLGLTWPGRLLH
ncbi:hypothetical protein MMPV_006366 [Pyropia vietnamensis]